MSGAPEEKIIGIQNGDLDSGNHTAYDNEHGKVSKPISIEGDPVNDRPGSVYGGAGGVDAR